MEALARASLDADCPAGYALELTHGAVDGIGTPAVGVAAAGDRIAVEDPCFGSPTCSTRWVAPLPVAVDAHGMQVDSLRQALEAGARAVLLTRGHTTRPGPAWMRSGRGRCGSCWSYPQVAVLIDDHYAASQQAYHSVLPLDGRRWAPLRSVVQTVNDLRLAWLACDEETAMVRGCDWRPAPAGSVTCRRCGDSVPSSATSGRRSLGR